ncbi:MAG: SAM-dependent chlorinase/fluorinase [Desulfarculaceae bacterium]|nr:SAM-dependent chlorinase/fluorinase [Desulfarculaceae bacterium]MCF8048882.1 SAM-dependent chlorinase/fluorinase [Desulfarculaceae bacterium]MCF8099227.1 SAM-dependent chlorinase/fluorinase [Desulfarculaceae bacterium]
MIITLTSDFGPGPYVGLMKGVILGLCPKANLVDLEHDLGPQDVLAGALVLEQAIGVFPDGTVHLAVVDPGVGTGRRPLVVEGAGGCWVGPDNGIFTPVFLADPQARAYEISDDSLFREPLSATFHGRDIFAPAAAALATGRDPATLGPVVSDPVRLDWPQPRRDDKALVGQVLMADRFGNLMTNLSRPEVEAFLNGRPAYISMAGGAVEGVSEAYGQVGPEKLLALFNSQGRLEMAVNQGSFLERLGLKPGNERGLEVRVEAD